jgi:hypothetical protein
LQVIRRTKEATFKEAYNKANKDNVISAFKGSNIKRFIYKTINIKEEAIRANIYKGTLIYNKPFLA